ncbi:MAG: hypothetical protein NTV62_01835 [Candidatus Gribaldobacteria bacterium]|nr:hypothetical protein [Candidatus Gribaldobacteria bacterium]
MLYKVFIDDSGQKKYKNPCSKDFIENPPVFKEYENFWRDNYFVLCGVRVKQDELGAINKSINKLKNYYFKTHKVEVKSDWLRNPHKRKKNYLEKFDITSEKLNKFGEKFIDIISENKEKLKIVAVVFDKRYYGDAKRKKEEGSPLLKTTQLIFERIQYAGGYHILVFDQMESSLKVTVGQHNKIINIFQKNAGMDKIFVDKYDRISDIKFMQSCEENFLQVADVRAYNIYRQFVEFGRDWCGKNQKDGKVFMETYSYFDRIRCNFLFNLTKKQARGVGLTCVPDGEKVNWDILDGCFSNKKTP